MLETTPIRAQLAAVRDDPLRVLVVGAGVAGVAAAQLLRGQGLHPVLVERSGPAADEGYMLALMPLVDPVVDELGLRREYLANSVGLDRYRARARTGAPLAEYSLGGLLRGYGDYRGIRRGELIELLGAGGGTVTHGSTVTGVREPPDAVAVTLDDGSAEVEADFDLVIAADGLHSATRRLVLAPEQVSGYDTGWGGWVAWAEPDADVDLSEELWGAGFFVGTYPVPDRLGVFVGGPRADTETGPERFAEYARARLSRGDARVGRALDVVAASQDAYFWSLHDRRAATWSVGRVVLLGDAAAGFLPTAGIGAAMAMESAGVLGAHLRGATPESVFDALREYERAQRPRVEAAQDNSRQLARLMFRRSALLALLRDTATRFVSLRSVLGPILKLLDDQPGIAAGGGQVRSSRSMRSEAPADPSAARPTR